MASGGSAGGGTSSGSGSSSFIDGVILLVFALVFNFLNYTFTVGGKTPLDEEYATSAYLIESGFEFENSEDLISGLEYFHQKTGVQLVILSTTESAAFDLTEELAVDIYYSLFYDEAHVLIIMSNSHLCTTYYAIGDLAHNVVDQNALNHLIWKIDHSTDGTRIGKQLRKFADKLIN